MDQRKQNILSLIKKKVHEIDPAAEIILFGSQARGDERKDSDWDILILIDRPASFLEEQTFRHHLFGLELELGEALSIFVYSKHDWNNRHSATPLHTYVSKEGIRL